MSLFNGLLNKWTPLAVIIILTSAGLIAVVVWYAFHFQAPPGWLLTFLGLIGGSGVFGVAHNTGVNAANGIAKDTAAATVNALVSGGLTNANTSPTTQQPTQSSN